MNRPIKKYVYNLVKSCLGVSLSLIILFGFIGQVKASDDVDNTFYKSSYNSLDYAGVRGVSWTAVENNVSKVVLQFNNVNNISCDLALCKGTASFSNYPNDAMSCGDNADLVADWSFTGNNYTMVDGQPRNIFDLDDTGYTEIGQNYFLIASTTDDIRYSDNNTNGVPSSGGAIYIKPYYDTEFVVPTNDYVMYYGEDPNITEINNTFNIPLVYNFCEFAGTSTSTESYYLDLYYPDTTKYFTSQILTSCSGTVNFNQSTETIERSDDNAVLRIFQGLLSTDVIVESESFAAEINEPLMNDDDYILYTFDNPLYVQTDNAGTSTMNFTFNFCSDDNFASSTVYLKNLDYGNTEITYIPTNCSGVGSLALPYVENLNMTLPATISYQRGGTEYLTSDDFMLVFWSEESPLTIPEMEDYFGTGIFTTAECTSTDWWTNSICNFNNKSLSIANFFGTQSSNLAKNSINVIKNVFPFNFAVKFKESFELAQNVEMPEELQWLEIGDGDGNINITFPKEFSNGVTDIEAEIWGPNVFAPVGSDMEDFFDHIQVLLKYLLWVSWIYGIYYMGIKAYNEMRSVDNKED